MRRAEAPTRRHAFSSTADAPLNVGEKYLEPEIVFPEEVFRPQLEAAIRELVGVDLILLPNFGLDITVLLPLPDPGRARFLEVKACPGFGSLLVPVGGRRGTGRQVDLLLLEEPQLRQLDQWVRWILAFHSDRQGRGLLQGEARYAFFTCTEAKAAMQNGVARDKQNMLVTTHFRNLITWDALMSALRDFML